jgi:hypothetical protein
MPRVRDTFCLALAIPQVKINKADSKLELWAPARPVNNYIKID